MRLIREYSLNCFLKRSKTCVTTLEYLLHRRKFHLSLNKPALSAPQAFFRADEATTRTPPARAGGFHVLVSYHNLWYAVNRAKKQTSIRFTPTATLLLKKLSEHLGISQSAVVELAIRTLAKQEGIRQEGVEQVHT